MNYEQELKLRRGQEFAKPGSVFDSGIDAVLEDQANEEREFMEVQDARKVGDDMRGPNTTTTGQEALDAIEADKEIMTENYGGGQDPNKSFNPIEDPIKPTQGPAEVPKGSTEVPKGSTEVPKGSTEEAPEFAEPEDSELQDLEYEEPKPVPEVVKDAPQGHVAHVGTTEAALVAQGAGSARTAFEKTLRAVGVALRMVSELYFNDSLNWPGVADVSGDMMDPGYKTVWETKEGALLMNSIQRMSQDPNDVGALRDMQLASAELKKAGRLGEAMLPELGLIPGSSPPELLAMSVTGLTKAGGVALLKTAAPYIAPAVVADMLVEEVAMDQDTWYEALAVGLVGGFGVGYGAFNVAPKVASRAKFGYRALKLDVMDIRQEAFLGAARKADTGPKSGSKASATSPKSSEPTKALSAPLITREKLEKAIRSRAEAMFVDVPPINIPVLMPAGSGALNTAITNVSVNVAPRLASKKVEAAVQQIEHNLAVGNLADEPTIEIAEEIFSAPTTAEISAMSAENAAAVTRARESIAKARESLEAPESSEAHIIEIKDQSNPFATNMDYDASEARTQLTHQVREQWYEGVPDSEEVRELRLGRLRGPFGKDRFIVASLDGLWAEKLGVSKAKAPMDFTEDYVSQYRATMKAIEKQGSAFGKAPEVSREVFNSLVEEYDAGIASEVASRMALLDHENMVAQKHSYVTGGIDSDDAKFMTPPSSTKHIGTRPGRTQGDTTSPYFHNDWTIEDHLVMTDGVDRLKFRAVPKQLPETPPGQINTNVSKIFAYPEVETATVLAQKARKFYDATAHKDWWVKLPKQEGEDFNRVTAKGAEKWKVPTKFYIPMAKRIPGEPIYNEGLALPDERVDAVARWLGWSEDLLVPWNDHAIKGTHSGKAYHQSVEDLKYLLDAADQMDITNPGYFERHQKGDVYFRELQDSPERLARTAPTIFDSLRPPAAYHKMRSAREVYRKQREAYLRKVLDKPVGYKPPKTKGVYGFDREMDRLAVIQDQLANDARYLRGSEQQGMSQRMYLMAADVIAGTTKYADVAEFTRIQARKTAQEAKMTEASASMAQTGQMDTHKTYTTPFATYDMAVRNTAVRESISYAAAAERMTAEAGGATLSDWNKQVEREQFIEEQAIDGIGYNEASDMFERQAHEREMESLRLADENEAWGAYAEGEGTDHIDAATRGRASDTSGAHLAGEELRISTKTDPHLQKLRADSLPRVDTQMPQMANLTAIEEKILGESVNAIEDIFGSRVIAESYTISGPGVKAKINPFKMNSVDDISDMIETARWAGGIMSDVDSAVGFTTSPGLSDRAASSMARLALDLDDMLSPAAQALVKDPDNVLKAVLFEKYRAAQGLLLDALKTGTMGDEAKAAVKTTDLMALDDKSILVKLASIVDDNYAMYGAQADTRMSVALADMYSALPTKADRLKWNQGIVQKMNETGYLQGHKDMLKIRKSLTELLREACE